MRKAVEVAYLQRVNAAVAKGQSSGNRGEVGVSNVGTTGDGGMDIVNEIDKRNPDRLSTVADSAGLSVDGGVGRDWRGKERSQCSGEAQHRNSGGIWCEQSSPPQHNSIPVSAQVYY